MAEFATIARPYAKALFDLADEKHQIESWLSGLKELAWAVRQPKVAVAIDDASGNAEQKAEILLGLLSDERSAKDPLFRNFVRVVASEKRFLILPEICAQYQDFALSRNNAKKAVVYSAFEFAGEGQKAKILADLEKHFNSRLDASFEVNPDLIGGIKVEVGDQVLDLSLQGKLQKLYATMTN